MIITFVEHDGCFGIDLQAETLQEAAQLVRLGMNRKAEIQHCSSSVFKDGAFYASVVFGKHKRASEVVPKRK